MSEMENVLVFTVIKIVVIIRITSQNGGGHDVYIYRLILGCCWVDFIFFANIPLRIVVGCVGMGITSVTHFQNEDECIANERLFSM